MLFVSIVGLIHLRHREFEARRLTNNEAALSIDAVRSLFPTADRLVSRESSAPFAIAAGTGTSHSAEQVLDSNGKLLGYVMQTSPRADHVIGFSGPTNVLIGFNEQEQIVGIRILSSRDTREHIAHVERDERFLSQWNGKNWHAATQLPHVDTVSGATLTSLAIVEGVTLRLGGQRPALRFPDELRLAEVTPFVTDAKSLRVRAEQPAITDILNQSNGPIGFAVRTTPAADAVIGYQGPTDALLVFDGASMLVGLALRKSYDNEPYVGYVRDEASFTARFVDRGFQELSKLDPQAEEIEGVSGATMTSMAVARSIAPALQAAERRVAPQSLKWNWSARDAGTALVLLFASVMSVTRWRSKRLLRLSFQCVLVGYLGFVNGDLLSQASLVGWAQAGIPFRTAPSLVLLTIAALLVPALSRTQLYCHQVCPFGAAQQLLARGRARVLRSRPATLRRDLESQAPQLADDAGTSTHTESRSSISNILSTACRALPALLLFVVVGTAIKHWPVSLVALEPFDAFHLRIAGAATLALAVVGLVVSAFVPMAYCRFGCPTGAMLNYLRFHSRSDCWSARDSIAVALLVMAACL